MRTSAWRCIKKAFLTLSAALGLAGCAAASSTECKSISKEKAVELAREQKRGMLSRAFRSRQENFASDTAILAGDRAGYAAKVSFKGKDGQELVGLIGEDCYVGWTIK
ncbi:hypothetical protein [Sphingomonas sp. TDK1]|uniref:hypothetical protein n=1 Tax=Sphingomonas sp. TDK1 TaxID=453247 RepID=UPI0007D9C2AE|nr:hypothetical protein [Sphingomonas sp. TDK1]OAN66522.1 hypothetical protein A7X12_10300 [Sphingomonas sp. TDK1]